MEAGGELCVWCRMQAPCRQCGVRPGPHARAARRVGTALAAAATKQGCGAAAAIDLAGRRPVRAAWGRPVAGHMHRPAGTRMLHATDL